LFFTPSISKLSGVSWADGPAGGTPQKELQTGTL
jgi:hypothetical protein